MGNDVRNAHCDVTMGNDVTGTSIVMSQSVMMLLCFHIIASHCIINDVDILNIHINHTNFILSCYTGGKKYNTCGKNKTQKKKHVNFCYPCVTPPPQSCPNP